MEVLKYKWPEIVSYGVSVFSFLILGKEMSGKEFGEEIKKHYDNPKAKVVAAAITEHLAVIKVRPDGMAMYKTNEEIKK